MRRNNPRVLFIPQLTRIGDIVCSTPAIHAVRQRYPSAYIAVLTTTKVRGVLEYNPDINKLIVFSARGIRDVIREIASERFTHAFSFSGTWLSTFLMASGKIPHRVKLVREGRPLAEALTDMVNTECCLYRDHRSAPRHYLSMLSSLGIADASLREVVGITADQRARVSQFMRDNGVANGDRLVGISLTAGNKIKEWGDNRFIELARALLKNEAVRIVWIGTAADRERITKAAQAASGTPRNIEAVGWPLEYLGVLIESLNVYIAVDTGPIYIAHAVGTPLIDITGPVDPWEQPPHDARSACVTPPAPFYPSSFVFKDRGSPEDHAMSLSRITVPMVLYAVSEIEKRERCLI